MPKGEKIFLKIRTSTLCNLYKCSPDTLRRWVREDRFNPTDLLDIIDKYQNKWKLDRRKRQESV